jgi:hypothetical protein
MSNEDIKNDIAKAMLSAAHELSLYIANANEELRKKVNSQTETEPDWHDTQTCYKLAQDSKRVEAMALRIKELENQNSLLEGGLKGFIHLMGLIESGSLENYPDHLSNYSDHCAEILEQSK